MQVSMVSYIDFGDNKPNEIMNPDQINA